VKEPTARNNKIYFHVYKKRRLHLKPVIIWRWRLWLWTSRMW